MKNGLIGRVFGALFDAFIKPVFDLLKPVLIVGVIVLLIVVVIYVGKTIYRSNKANRDEQKYIDGMKAKYANRSKKELEEIYSLLTRLENCRKKAAKKNAYAQSRDEQESALITSMGVTMLEEELFIKYSFIVYKYRHHDIAYLKSLL